jgi:prolyl oligopeptidase
MLFPRPANRQTMSTPREDRRNPPETRREVVTETLHGEEIPDPYRWLEDGDDPAVKEWVEAQNEYTDAHLDTATRDHLRPEMEELAEVADYGGILVEAGRYFQTVEAPEDDHGRLFVRDAPDGDGTVLVDPNEWPENNDDDAPTLSMSWFRPAPDGDHVVYGVTEGGDEQYDLHVISVPDAEEVAVLEDRGRVNPGMVAWDADGEGLYYVATGGADEGAQMDKQLRHWRFDGDEETLLEHDDQHVWPLLSSDADSGTLAVGFMEMVGGVDWSVLVDGELRPVIEDSEAETFVSIQDDTVFLRTDHDAPNKRVLSCSLERFRAGGLALSECDVVLPERDAILEATTLTADHLVANYQTDAHSRLSVYTHDGEHVRDLDLPEYVSVAALTSNDDAPEVFYQVSGFDRPQTLVCADPTTGETRELAGVDVDVPDDIVIEQTFVESTDGAEVPLFVCHREGVEHDGDNPTVLYGYGGFRNNMTPNFRRFRLPFLADGGVYAQVCARGGQEYGEAWHEAGMLENKQHTFDDFVAAGEYLCAAGYTSPDRLAVSGGSNGGLSVGAVVTQRPDLWTAAQCAVPLLDMLRFHRFLLGESWTTEYGHPENEDHFGVLREYSPYHNVDPEADYPAVLFSTAAGDTRVHPSHARKMAARMQAEADGGPFLLRTKTDTGHGVGKPTSMVVKEQVDGWTFLYDQLGLGE